MEKTEYTKRYIARIDIEAETPMAVGSGEKDIMTDSTVIRDVNGLPFIPGTAIAGIVRHAIGEETAKEFFGYHNGNGGKGSEIMFTAGRMIGEEGKVMDGLKDIDYSGDFYSRFEELPIRQHVKINEKGTAVKAGKFDEQVVFKGTRFRFEIEMAAKRDDEKSKENFETVLKKLNGNSIRVGHGGSKGFGEIRIVSMKTAELDLENKDDLEKYLEKSSSLEAEWEGYEERKIETEKDEKYIEYELRLKPEDFYLFGSGMGNEGADMTPVKEFVIKWDNDGKPRFEDKYVLIPASSVKGALSHRIAYYYNKKKGRYAEDNEGKTAKENEAVETLFGSEADKGGNGGRKGKVMIGDAMIEDKEDGNKKYLNHVSIDPFTGGAINGALFTEEVTYMKEEKVELKIMAEKTEDEEITEAFENALKDVARGMLPLGGGVNRGNGTFTGTVKRNAETIYEYKN